jgi:hypothetical protein
MHLDGLRRRIRTRCRSWRQRHRCNERLARLALLHFDIIQRYLCTRTATLLPSYLGDFSLSACYFRWILPERRKLLPSITHRWLTGRIF